MAAASSRFEPVQVGPGERIRWRQMAAGFRASPRWARGEDDVPSVTSLTDVIACY